MNICSKICSVIIINHCLLISFHYTCEDVWEDLLNPLGFTKILI